MQRVWQCLLFVACLLVLMAERPSRARDLTRAEQLFAELAMLSPGQRQGRIIEGAKREGTFRFVHSLRGDLGRDHIDLFPKRYPFVTVEQSELAPPDASQPPP